MSEHKTLDVEIIGPERPLYDGKALAVSAKGWDGELGILPGHAPLVTRLGIGEVRVKRGTLANAVTDRFAIRQGYLQVVDDKVVVLTEDARSISDLAAFDTTQEDLLTAKLQETRNAEERARIEDDLAWLRSCRKLATEAS